MSRLTDWVLSKLQRTCKHDPRQVAADVMEGATDISVMYCNRCGAIRFGKGLWRLPDPNLWRG